MLEERGGWISGGAQRHDVKMTDAVIELMVEAIKYIFGDNLNPFKKQNGEILPLGMLENASSSQHVMTKMHFTLL